MMSREFDNSIQLTHLLWMASIQLVRMYQRKKSFLRPINLGQYPSEVSRALAALKL